MRTVKLLWFLLWRMTLLGAAYGAVVVIAVAAFQVVALILISRAWFGGLYEIFLGVISAAVGGFIGLLLGLLCGFVLFAWTRVLYWPRSADGDGYRTMSGRVCASTAVLALLGDWVIHGVFDRYRFGPEEYSGFFDPFIFVLWRIMAGHEHNAVAFDVVTAVNLTIMVVVPTLLFAWAMRRAGMKVAESWLR